jgi:hypothetical protein
LQAFLSTNGGGLIQGDAINTVSASSGLVAVSGIDLEIDDTIFGGSAGGRIGGNAVVTLSARNIATPSTASGIPGTDQMAIEASIYPNASGTVGGNAIVSVSASQNISAPGSVLFWVANGNYQNLGGGMIGGDAKVDVSAPNISTGDLFDQILNYGGASIGGVAAINTTADTLSVGGNLAVLIDNSQGGRIGSSATINYNISGNATIANDATFEILGSDGAVKGAAINFNGGNYGVGGTFLSSIDGDGAITFSNASIRADIIKVGVLGTNGTLTIGGGAISANTLLKLYAPGSNGTLNFVANVTLSSGTAANLAANTITIQPSVVVKIAGNGGPANIFTSNPNYNFTPGPGYTGPPGNPSNGKFGGNGALDPQPLANAPLFGDPPTSSSSGAPNTDAQTVSSANVTSSGKVNGGLGGARQKRDEPAVPNGKTTGARINVGSSAQLLSMLDAAAPGPGGKITIPASQSVSNSSNSNRRNADGRVKADRGTVDTQHARDRADNPPALASARSFAR